MVCGNCPWYTPQNRCGSPPRSVPEAARQIWSRQRTAVVGWLIPVPLEPATIVIEAPGERCKVPSLSVPAGRLRGAGAATVA